jgi:hypothetical protein
MFMESGIEFNPLDKKTILKCLVENDGKRAGMGENFLLLFLKLIEGKSRLWN